MDASSRHRDFVFRCWFANSLHTCREDGKNTDGPVEIVSVRHLQWRKSADAVSLCCVGNFLLSVSVELDSDSEVLCDGDRCGCTAHDSADVPAVTLGRRTHNPLRSEAPPNCWSPDCRRGIPPICSPRCAGPLLDRVLSSFRYAWAWHGH